MLVLALASALLLAPALQGVWSLKTQFALDSAVFLAGGTWLFLETWSGRPPGVLRDRRNLPLLAAALFSLVSSVLGPVRPLVFQEWWNFAAGLFVLALAGVEPRSVSDRLDWWTAAWRMVSDRPFLGFGAGSFAFVYPEYRGGPGLSAVYAHNYYLEFLAENGVLSAAALSRPKDPFPLYDRAEAFYMAGAAPPAKALLFKALALEPGFVRARLMMAEILFREKAPAAACGELARAGRIRDGKKTFTRAAEYDPALLADPPPGNT